ncbi:hypothetical protein [Helicobacter trogontum]|uniref:hypothetical protein n=1 Tax=Helicobacter trogontum TaxID=50960 RepID=UPI001319FBAE|nr:hypothetical protein [Helicobacter trogontum]
MKKSYKRQSFQELVEMVLIASQKRLKNSQHYSKTSQIGRDARFTLSKKALRKIQTLAKQNNYKQSVVIRAAIDILFYKAETMEYKKFYNMIHGQYLALSIESLDMSPTHKKKMLDSLEWVRR